MFILKKGHQPGVYVPLRALFLVPIMCQVNKISKYFGLYLCFTIVTSL